MEDSCNKPDDLTVRDIFNNTKSMLEKMGASETCKKAADTWGKTNSTSFDMQFKSNTQVGMGIASNEMEGGIAGQDSGTEFQNSMNEAGCGTFVAIGTNISSNIKKIQCTISKAQNSSEVNIDSNNVLNIQTLEPSEYESAEKTKLLRLAVDISTRPKLSDFADLLTGTETMDDKIKFSNEIVKPAQDQWLKERIKLTESIKSAYPSSDINMKNSEFKQVIGNKIKIINSLTASESSALENATKEISKTVAEQEIEQKGGVNAGDPNVRSATETNIQKNENLTASSINAKVQSIKNSIKSSNKIEIKASGSINMDNVRIDQSILNDIAVESIISSAIQAGIKSATEFVSDSSTMQKVKTEQKGLDDLVKAQGEANAAAISANKVVLTGFGGSSGLGVIFFIAFLFFAPPEWKDTIKWTFIGLMGLAVAIIIMYWSMIAATLKQNIDPNKLTFEEKEKLGLVKRPLAYYNKLWLKYGFTKELTYDDIAQLKLDDIDDKNIYEVINKFIFERCLNNDEEVLPYCFTDGKLPSLYLPKIRRKPAIDLKNPANGLTVSELRYMWEKGEANVTVKNAPTDNSYLESYITKWNSDKDAYIKARANNMVASYFPETYSEVVVSMGTYVIDKIKAKLPKDLTKYDILLLLKVVALCDDSKTVPDDKISEYKKLPDIDSVIASMKSCF